MENILAQISTKGSGEFFYHHVKEAFFIFNTIVELGKKETKLNKAPLKKGHVLNIFFTLTLYEYNTIVYMLKNLDILYSI